VPLWTRFEELILVFYKEEKAGSWIKNNRLKNYQDLYYQTPPLGFLNEILPAEVTALLAFTSIE